MQSQVLYVVPITSVLGRLPVVPVGTTGTMPYSMRMEQIRSRIPSLGHPVTQAKMQLTAADGGTSTPWP